MSFNVWIMAQVADAAGTGETSLSAGGLAVMCVSVGTVLCLIGFCLYRVFTLPPVENEEDEFHPPRSLSM